MEEREMLPPLLMEGCEILLPVERMGEEDTLLILDWMPLLLNEEPGRLMLVEPGRLMLVEPRRFAEEAVLLLLRFTVTRVELLVR